MRWAVVAVALVMCGTSARAADEFEFTGPLPTRNFQPIQLIFLQLPFESPATVAVQRVELQLQSAESNVIATTQGGVESELKFETNRTVFGLRYGLAPGWEVGFDLPFISRFGGFLDPIMDEIEGLVGAGNPERDLFRNNTFGAFHVIRSDGTQLFEAGEVTFAPGDLWFSAKRAFRAGGAWPRFALRAAVKAPTGDAGDVTGSGEPDFGVGVLLDYRPWRRLALYLNVNLVYPLGPITAADLTLNPMVSESFAAEAAITRTFGALLHQAVYTSPMHGTGTALLDNPVVELGFGFNWRVCEPLAVQLLGMQNMSGVESAADFTLLLAFRGGFAL